MWDYIEDRVLDEAKYIVANGATVRAAAKYFGVSKSTVHKDITERLPLYDGDLYDGVRKVLLFNLQERHLRGGFATKAKYASKREKR